MPRYWLIGGGILVAVLLAVGVILALAGGEQVLDEGTPERAVQDYLKAVSDQDYAAVHASLSKDEFPDCKVEDLVSQGFRSGKTVRDQRITLEDTQIVNGTAIVTVGVSRLSSEGPFGSTERSHNQTYSLRQDDGAWKFIKYPWPYFNCGNKPPASGPAPPPDRTPPPTPAPEPDGEGS